MLWARTRSKEARTPRVSWSMQGSSLTIGLLLVGLSVVGCAPHEDVTPQIEVSPNVKGRLKLMPGHGPGDSDEPIGQPSTPPREAAPAFARALSDEGVLKGEAATGKPGDLVIGNDEIVLVVRARVGEALEIADVGDAKNKVDGMGAFVPGALARKDAPAGAFVVERSQAYASEDGSAKIVVGGRVEGMSVTTTLALAKTDRAVLITTTYDNDGDKPAGPFDARDEIGWGPSRPFAPKGATNGAASGTDAREYKGAYVGAAGPRVSYAVTSTTGEVDATIGPKSTRVHLDRELLVSAHSQKTFDRVLVVGARSDSSSVVAELVRASGGDLGTVSVRLAGGAATSPTAPITLLVRTASGEDALTIVGTPSEIASCDLPPGVFTIRSASLPPGEGTLVTVRKDQTSEITVRAP
jgi:hypothetical protein